MTSVDLFKRGMRRLASGVSIVTTRHNDTYSGLVATAVSSLSGEPPSLLVCVHRASSSHGLFHKAGVFCVNLLGGADAAIASSFSSPRKELRFTEGTWAPLITGAPALVDSLASFDCRVAKSIEFETHTIFIGMIEAIELWQDHVAPLLYVDGRYRTLPSLAAQGA
ncbi:flavin reductase family protein [Terrarubrum flagellatum]|uniref:flavin reductase family protein n=1 Tax=Terrirubrum flagellatum TaxID=2895980 RepID=UPI003145550D